jgi:hypothetical protein
MGGMYGSFAGVQPAVYGTVMQQQPMYQQPVSAVSPIRKTRPCLALTSCRRCFLNSVTSVLKRTG